MRIDKIYNTGPYLNKVLRCYCNFHFMKSVSTLSLSTLSHRTRKGKTMSTGIQDSHIVEKKRSWLGKCLSRLQVKDVSLRAAYHVEFGLYETSRRKLLLALSDVESNWISKESTPVTLSIIEDEDTKCQIASHTHWLKVDIIRISV